MVDQDKNEEIIVPAPVRGVNEAVDKKTSAAEQAIHFGQEKQEKHKTRISQDDAIVSAELRREIELMKMDAGTQQSVDKTVQKVEFLGQKEKIEHLLKIARENGGEKGVLIAVKSAEKMGDPSILDTLHDVLHMEIKQFLQSTKK